MQLFSLLALVASADLSFSQDGCHASHNEKLHLHQQGIPAKCFVKPKTGNCFAYFPSYFYNAESNECQESIFGGCGDGCFGFHSKKECESSCIKFSIQMVPAKRSFTQDNCIFNATGVNMVKYKNTKSKCFIKTKTGACRARVPSYHFDADKGSCVRSTFGGCQDGCQAFPTLHECDEACN